MESTGYDFLPYAPTHIHRQLLDKREKLLSKQMWIGKRKEERGKRKEERGKIPVTAILWKLPQTNIFTSSGIGTFAGLTLL